MSGEVEADDFYPAMWMMAGHVTVSTVDAGHDFGDGTGPAPARALVVEDGASLSRIVITGDTPGDLEDLAARIAAAAGGDGPAWLAARYPRPFPLDRLAGRLAARMWADLLADFGPQGVRLFGSWSAVHDVVDANEYAIAAEAAEGWDLSEALAYELDDPAAAAVVEAANEATDMLTERLAAVAHPRAAIDRP